MKSIRLELAKLALLSIMAVIVFSTACQSMVEETVVESETIESDTAIPGSTNLIRTPLGAPSVVNTAPEVTQIPSSRLTVTPVASLESNNGSRSDSLRCGIRLPILPAPSVVENEPITATIPESFIPDSALPALSKLLNEPDSVGLAAFEIGREAEGVFHNADVPMPLASVVKILNLIAYAEAVDSGQIDPGSWVPLSEMEKFYLPGMDLGSHRRALQDLENRGLVAFDPPMTPMEEIPGMMIRYSSNAAADYLHLLVGQELIEETAVSLSLKTQTAPCPWIGQFLAMKNYKSTGSDLAAVRKFIQDPGLYSSEVMRLTDAFITDSEFLSKSLVSRSSRASIQAQSLFAENLNSQGSAGDYARLMAQILSNELASSYQNILVRRTLEWPRIFPDNQELFRVIGYKSGSLPGVLTTVYYAERLTDQARVVVALFYRRLPMSTYRDWRQTLPHDEFARWILSDPKAIPGLKNLLDDSSG